LALAAVTGEVAAKVTPFSRVLAPPSWFAGFSAMGSM
jgi:hypothetical protein